MKKVLLSLCAGAMIASVTALAAHATENSKAGTPAEVTFTVLRFRPVVVANSDTQYTDAMMTLLAHPLVTVTGDSTNAVLHPHGAVDIEIRVQSIDPLESYTPVGIVFQQQVVGNGPKTDCDGRNNFAQAHLNGSSLIVHDNFVQKGPDYRYEFFLVIQRGSDGKIGIIDPGIVNETD
jgi:hypothetical protein